MAFRLRPIDETAVRQILTWKYERPYDIYNLNKGEPIDMVAEMAYFATPAYRFHQILAEDESLTGFCSFGVDGQVPGGEYTAVAIDIGLGVRPDLTGRGLGVSFARAVSNFARQQYQPPRLRVTIAEFNQRAQKVWRKLGFVPIQTFVARQERPFVVMMKEMETEKGSIAKRREPT